MKTPAIFACRAAIEIAELDRRTQGRSKLLIVGLVNKLRDSIPVTTPAIDMRVWIEHDMLHVEARGMGLLINQFGEEL